jgi:hypothetical protein
MGLDQLFAGHEPSIREQFGRIAAESGVSGIRLKLVDTDSGMLFRSVPSERTVNVEWRGIASLWATSQAIGRLAREMFNARRSGASRLEFPNGSSPQELGLLYIEYAKQLCVRQPWRWNTFFPKPDPNPTDEDTKRGETFFLRSLEWILRHEIAHIALGHQDSAWSADESRAQERDADRHASEALKGDLSIDPGRPAGAKPSESELSLERRALAAGIGLVWVALYEKTAGSPNEMYPPIADRLYRSFDLFALAPDCGAAEILSDFIKAWVDPEANWPEAATAQLALDDSCARLDEYIRAHRRLEP